MKKTLLFIAIFAMTVGTIFANPVDRQRAQQIGQNFMNAKIGQKTAIELKPLEQFFPAEEYHQDYLVKNPNGYCHIPRDLIQKVRQKLEKTHACD